MYAVPLASGRMLPQIPATGLQSKEVSFADSVDFGSYHVLSPGTKRVQARLSDEALYALAMYMYSLEPPPNPNAHNDKATAGERIFIRERCARCHTPPLYTNNKLTLAEGFSAPKDAPATLDILPISVGTDPGLALATRSSRFCEHSSRSPGSEMESP